ncbi:MAG: FG-GAP repeat domain-containing protein [Methylococcaceae bacterium]
MTNNKFSQLTAVFSLLFLMSSNASAVEPKTDFNGDGKADVLIRNIFSGALNGWLINGTTVSAKPSFGKVLPKTGKIIMGIKDANGDGRSDLYWYNVNTGNVSAWLMNGSTISSRVSYGGLNPKDGWSPYGLADLNNDSKNDLVWYNVYTGEIRRWFTNGAIVTKKQIWGTLPPNDGWFPIGIKDLNGNGLADLLIYNPYNGNVGAWLDNGAVRSYATLNPSSGWIPIGLEDFNGDNKADVLWQNSYSGDIVVWLINGAFILNIVPYGNNPPNNGWSIAGFSDFNNDGKTDIFWYSAYTGGTIAWLTDIGEKKFGTLSPTEGWRPMGLDDFNGDGKADLLWFNAYSNATTTWLLNGSGILQTANYGSILASSVWTINIPR